MGGAPPSSQRPEIWATPGTEVRLADDEVHVWRVSLDAVACRAPSLWWILADGERARADTFRFPDDRRRFILVRAVLRFLLGRYLDRDPNDLTLEASSTGKPRLTSAGEDIQFNVSHSHGLALIAVATRRRVGVDVERIRRDVDALAIAARAFCPREVATLRAVPAERRTQAFFAGWTRKEAYVKATGDGFARPLDGFEVSLAPGEPAALLWAARRPEESRRWALCELAVGRDYAAALAAEGREWRLACWHWPGALRLP